MNEGKIFVRTAMARWSATWAGRGFEFPELPVACPSDIDEFLEDGSGNQATREGRSSWAWDEDDEEKEDTSNGDESKKFWESQYQLLQRWKYANTGSRCILPVMLCGGPPDALSLGGNPMDRAWDAQTSAILCRSSPTESRIRGAEKEALKEIEMAADEICDCRRPTATAGGYSCRNCLMGKVSSRLQKAGFNIAVCKCKWTNSPQIPSGEHTFLDVLEATSKKGEVRVIIELNFRAEFEMARASEEYNGLVQQLPEVFVGKVERLQSIIRILCSAAKRCMKEKRMHIGPWRKHRYMLAKWLGPCERRAPLPTLPIGLSGQPRRPRASMLTIDLTGKLPSIHQTAVEVV